MMTFDMKRASLQRSRRMLAAAILGVTALVAGCASTTPAQITTFNRQDAGADAWTDGTSSCSRCRGRLRAWNMPIIPCGSVRPCAGMGWSPCPTCTPPNWSCISNTGPTVAASPEAPRPAASRWAWGAVIEQDGAWGWVFPLAARPRTFSIVTAFRSRSTG